MGNICTTNQPIKTNNDINSYVFFSKMYEKHNIYTSKEIFEESRENICRVIDVYDGDTCKIALNYNNNENPMIYRITVRLKGIDTPEIKTKDFEEKRAAIKARNKLLSLITTNGRNKQKKDVIEYDEGLKNEDIKEILTRDIYLVKIKTYEFDKYGRLLCELFPYDSEESYNKILIESKMGYSYDGGTKKRK